MLCVQQPTRKAADNIVAYDSVPAALHYEKFIMPDALRIVDAMVETLNY